MTGPRETAAAEVLRRTPPARRSRVRRLLAAPFAPAALVSLPTDRLTIRAPIARPLGPRRLLKVTVERWHAAARGWARGLAREARNRLKRLRTGRP